MKNLLSVLVLSLFGFGVAIAAPPGSVYEMGETIDPSCAQGSLNCETRAPAASGANSDITSLQNVDRIGLGKVPDASRFIDQLATDTSTGQGTVVYNNFDTVIEPTSDHTTDTRYGIYSYLSAPNTNTNFVRNMWAIGAGSENYGTGNVEDMTGVEGWAYNAANATITDGIWGGWFGAENDDGSANRLIGLESEIFMYGGTTPVAASLRIDSGEVLGGTITNRYGILIEDQSGTGTAGTYGIYQAGSDDENYFAGDIAVGITTPAADAKVDINGKLNVRTDGSIGGETTFLDEEVYFYVKPQYTNDSSGYAEIGAWDNAGASQGPRNLAINPFGGNVGILANDPKTTLQVGDQISVAQSTTGSGSYTINAYHDAGTERRIFDGSVVRMTVDPTLDLFALQVAGDGVADSAFAYTNVYNVDQDTGHIGFQTLSLTHPLTMASGAHVTAGGVWTNASSRELKKDIYGISREEAYDVLSGLEPVHYRYKADDGEEYLGFIAEDVPDLVATGDRKGLASMDIVAALTKVLQDQVEENNQLKELVCLDHADHVFCQ